MSARSRFDLDNELNRNGESRNDEDIEKTATFRQLNPILTGESMLITVTLQKKKLFLNFLAKSNHSEMSKKILENL